MKIIKHKKLHLRLLSLAICFLLLTETLFGYGIQTAYAAQTSPTVLEETNSDNGNIEVNNSSNTNEDNYNTTDSSEADF